MIEDAKLRELFKAESEEHLQHLDDALLRPEKTPADQALLEEAFREAHSLKGAAANLFAAGIKAAAFEIEQAGLRCDIDRAMKLMPKLKAKWLEFLAHPEVIRMLAAKR